MSRLSEANVFSSRVSPPFRLNSQPSTMSDKALDGGKYLCGKEISAADIIMSYPLEAAREGGAGITKAQYPRLWSYASSPISFKLVSG